MKKVILTSILALSLMACGGSDDSDSSNNSNSGSNNSGSNNGGSTDTPSTDTKTGTFTDTIVTGVKYSTNSGISGKTDDHGSFNFKEGDKITFSVGDVQLGNTVTADEHVTYSDLSEDSDTQSNLLVFLQTFDEDKNAENGVVITDSVNTAFEDKSINFDQDPASFSTDTTLNTVASATGATVVNATTAYTAAQKALYKYSAGVYQLSTTSGQTVDVLMHIQENGQFLFSQTGEASDGGTSGIELGTLEWNPLNGDIKPSESLDTNGEWGLFGADNDFTLTYDGTNLILDDNAEEASYTLTPVKNVSNSLVGAWQLNGVNGQVFVFFENGQYNMLDHLGDTNSDSCGGAGVELGKYTINNNTLMIHDVSVDTNGCAGLSDNQSNSNIPFSVQGDTFTLSPEGEGSFGFTRIQ